MVKTQIKYKILGSVNFSYFALIHRLIQTTDKFSSILQLVTDLERIHPYHDFNCRTFAVLMLNRELIKNGYAPTIMEDPNVFDYKNLDDLKSLVCQGQESFKNLVETGVVHTTDPSNELWYNEIKTYNIPDTIIKIQLNRNQRYCDISNDDIAKDIKSQINEQFHKITNSSYNNQEFNNQPLITEAQKIMKNLLSVPTEIEESATEKLQSRAPKSPTTTIPK